MKLLVGEYRGVECGGVEPGSCACAGRGVELRTSPGVKRRLVRGEVLRSDHVCEKFLTVSWYFVRGFGLEYGVPECRVDVVNQVGEVRSCPGATVEV